MDKGKIIISSERMQLTINRLAQHIIENHGDLTDLCIIGVQESGVHMADRICEQLHNQKYNNFHYGKLDITFYRDDFRRRETPIKAAPTDIDFGIEDKKVILIDDVLYTGRTVHAAISALLDIGRPKLIELMCMVDRRFNRHFPIKADYYGITIDSLDDAYVKVRWKEIDKISEVRLYSGNIKSDSNKNKR
jgi:pyrimidine operon attenuation protein/uracil phosphoribosyltransferase